MIKKYVFHTLAIIIIIIEIWWIWENLLPKRRYYGELSRPEGRAKPL